MRCQTAINGQTTEEPVRPSIKMQRQIQMRQKDAKTNTKVQDPCNKIAKTNATQILIHGAANAKTYTYRPTAKE